MGVADVESLSSRERRRRVERAFVDMDADGDARISRRELERAFRRAKAVRLRPAEVESIAAAFDADGDGMLQWGELSRMLCDPRLARRRLGGRGGDDGTLSDTDISGSESGGSDADSGAQRRGRAVVAQIRRRVRAMRRPEKTRSAEAARRLLRGAAQRGVRPRGAVSRERFRMWLEGGAEGEWDLGVERDSKEERAILQVRKRRVE